MSGNTKLAGAATAAAGTYVHDKNSYRVVLSPEGLKDFAIVVSPNPNKGKGGSQPDVCVEVYSASYFKKTGKKVSPRCHTPEITLRWSDLHTIGDDYQGESKDLRQRKNGILLQTKFIDNYDKTINDKIANFAASRQPYTDINEEVRWFYERLVVVRNMICRAIWEHKDTLPSARAGIILDARAEVAKRRGVESYAVKSDDPEVSECAFEIFMRNPYMSKVLMEDQRTSEPDTCPTGEDCMGPTCTHAEHKRGKREYVIKAQRRVFSMRNYDAEKHAATAGLMSKAVQAEWDAANPEALAELDEHALRQARDTYACQRMNELGYIYTPVFYRRRETVKISKDNALRTLGPKQDLYREMHKSVLGRGNIIRMGVRFGGQAFPTKGGMGMTLTFDATDIVILAQPPVSDDYSGGDEIMWWGDDVPAESAQQVRIASVDILNDHPDSTIPNIEMSDDGEYSGGGKRAHEPEHFSANKRAHLEPEEYEDEPY